MPPEQETTQSIDSNPHWGADDIDADFKELDDLMAEMNKPESDVDDTDVVDTETEEAEETEVDEAETEEETEDADADDTSDAADDSDTAAEDNDGDDESDDDGEDPEEEVPTSVKIPKERLDKEVKKRRAAEDQLRALQDKIDNRVQDTDLGIDDDDFAKVADAINDGETKVAQGLLKDMFTKVAQVAENRAYERITPEIDARAVNAVTKLDENTELDITIETIEETYDFLNPKSENFEPELIEDVLALQASGMRKGQSKAVAMQEAVKKVIRLEKPDLVEAEADDIDTVRAVEKRSVQKKLSLKKKVKIAAKQPSTLEAGRPNRTEDTDLVDLESITDDEFDALPASAQARLRGDTF